MKILRGITLLLLSTISALYASGLEAKVLSTKGKVEIQQGTSWVALKSGDSVKSGSVISTGFKSSVELDVNGSKVQLGPLTRMTLEKLIETDKKTESSLYLDSGKVSADVKKSGNKRTGFKVSTPVATASVRGTSFSMGSDGSLTTKEGLVSKGPAESPSPVISEEATDYLPEEGESTALTSTEDISGSYGIPVFAGQTSTTDTLTGIASTPQTEAAKSASDLSTGTATLSSQEKVVTALSSSQCSAADAASTDTVVTSKGTGNLVINISVSTSD